MFDDLFLELINIKAGCCIGGLSKSLDVSGRHTCRDCISYNFGWLCTTCRDYRVLIVIRFIVTTFLP